MPLMTSCSTTAITTAVTTAVTTATRCPSPVSLSRGTRIEEKKAEGAVDVWCEERAALDRRFARHLGVSS